MIFGARVCGSKYFRFFSQWVFFSQFFAHVSAGSNISCSFRALLYFRSCAQVTAGSNVLGSFSAFCYKFCE